MVANNAVVRCAKILKYTCARAVPKTPNKSKYFNACQLTVGCAIIFANPPEIIKYKIEKMQRKHIAKALL